MYPFPIWFWLMKGAHSENPKTWLYVQATDFVHFFEIITGFDHNWKNLGFVLLSRECLNRNNAIHIASIWWECFEIETK